MTKRSERCEKDAAGTIKHDTVNSKDAASTQPADTATTQTTPNIGDDKPRNIVFIMTDTQRTDMLGCYGNADMHTPGIDALAARGVRYERAYSCQPVCGPARSAIFTGTYPHSNGSWGNSMPLGANVKTVGQRLRDHGYHTAYVGKWHLDGGDYFGLGRAPDGWDPAYWYDMRNYLEEMSDEERLYSRRGENMLTDEIPETFTYAYKATERAVSFLEEATNDDKPYLLVMSYDEPHGPSLAPEPYASMYKDYEFPKSPNIWDDLSDKPSYQRVWAGKSLHDDKDTLTLKPRFLLGCNSFVDSQIGRLVARVKALDPTAIIIYTSDHGDMMASHSLWAKGPAAYDEITRIPLIIHDPAIPESHGTVYTPPVSHINLTPTMLDYAGIPQPKLMEGPSIRATVEDRNAKVQDRIYLEFGRYEIDHDGFGGFRPMRAVFDGRYKLALHLLSSDELYDLQEDPQEMTNLIDREDLAEIRDSLHDALLEWMNQTRDPFRGYDWERRPWRQDARPATWDYTGYTRQRENEEYEPRQLDYSTGLEMEEAHRPKGG